MSESLAISRRMASLPVRGAWIEIGSDEWVIIGAESRSPCGERGLKFLGMYTACAAYVAPRAGSVD